MRKIQIALVFGLSIGVGADADSGDGYILTKNQRTLEQIEGVEKGEQILGRILAAYLCPRQTARLDGQ